MFQFRENINDIKFIGAFLSYLSRRVIGKEIILSMRYLQAHREKAMANLIAFTMK